MHAKSGRHQSTLVGREPEERQLMDLLGRLRAGRGLLVLVDGEAGIGKTALVESLALHAVDQDFTVVDGYCYDLTASTPYGFWIDLFHREHLDEPAWESLVTLFDPHSGEQPASQQELFDRTSDLLQQLSESRPLLIVLEDLQWADPAGLELLRMVARRLRAAPVALVATYRSDELTRRQPLVQILPALVRESRAERMTLQPFDRENAREFVRRDYHLDDASEDRLVTYLLEHTEGNPLYLEELLRSLVHDGVIWEDDGDWKLAVLDRTIVPPLIEQLISSRLAQLDPDTRRTLDAAAVVGLVVPYDILLPVLDWSDEKLSGHIREAREAGLMLQQGEHLTFRHALILDVLYEALVIPERRSWHRRIADQWIATSQPDPDIVATHLVRAGDGRAAGWLIRAGNRAHRAYALRMAAERFQTALRLMGRPDNVTRDYGWLLYRTARLMRFSNPEGGVTYLEEAERVAETVGDPVLDAYARADRGMMRCFYGEVEVGLSEIEGGVAELARLARDGVQLETDVFHWIFDDLPAERVQLDNRYGSQPSDYVVAQRWGAHVYWTAFVGRFRDARSIGERYLRDERTWPPGILGGLGIAYAALGEAGQSRDALQQAHALLVDAGNHVMADYFTNLETVVVHLRFSADDLSQRARLRRQAASAWHHSLDALPSGSPSHDVPIRLLLLEGEWAQARHLARLEILRGFQINRSFALADLLALATWQGEYGVAERYLRDLLPEGAATAPGGVNMLAALEAQRLAAEMAIERGDLSDARAWLQAHDTWLEWSDAVADQPARSLLDAQIHRADGDMNVAERLAGETLQTASQPRQPLILLAAHRLLGEILTGQARYADARAHLQSALDLSDACKAIYERARTEIALAGLEHASGDATTAWSLLDAADLTVRRLEAQPMLDQIDFLTQKLGGRRRPRSPQPDLPAVPMLPAGLTEREAEILRLLATGLSNREMASLLGLSIRTIERHVSNIYIKIDAHNRVDATAFAIRRDLV